MRYFSGSFAKKHIPFLFLILITIFSVILRTQQTHKKQQVAGIASSPGIFAGVNVDVCLLNPNSPDYVKNSQGQDLTDIAGHLGINFFRINDANGKCTNGGSSGGGQGSAANWGLVLNKMARYGIQAQIVSGQGGGFGSGSIGSAVNKVINNQLGTYPNVYGYDLVNEPYLDPQSIAAMVQARQQIKAVYPNLRITVGGWKTLHGVYNCPANFTGTCWQLPQDGQYLAPVVDYYSPHIYEFDRKLNGPYPDPTSLTTQYIDQMLSYTNGTPIIIGEYGAGNGWEITDQGTLGSPELQANVTFGVINAVKSYQSKGLLGAVQWAFYNRSTTCCGTPGWDLVYHNGDTILPAGYVIQKLMTGVSDVAMNPPLPIMNKEYIFQLADNGKTVSINQNDIVGFDLNFTSGSYTFGMTPSSAFIQTEPFNNSAYKGVLHAAGTGTATVVLNNTNCSANCQAFQMTFVISPGSISPTPVPTNNPAQGISLTLCPHGIANCGDNANPQSTGNMNPSHTTRQVTVSVSDSNNNPVTSAQGNVTFDSTSGTFKGTVPLSGIASGQYIVKVTLPQYLTKIIGPSVVQITQGQITTTPQTSLIAGDIDGDNRLDILDYNQIVNCFGIKQCSNKQYADITDDGKVDGVDYNLFLRELTVQYGQ